MRAEGRAAAATALLVCAFAAVAAAQAPTRLEARVDAILQDPEYARSLWGIEVRELATGRVLVSRGAEKLVQPASTMKLLTTAAALDAFGPEKRFATTLESAARVDEGGRLLGDLYLVGGGDLGFSARFSGGRAEAGFEALSGALARAGVRSVEGRVIGHDGLFSGERRPEGWDWDDLVWSYGAEISALIYNDNSADLSARPGRAPGAPLIVSREPESRHYQVLSTATTSRRGTRPELKLSRPLGGNQIRLSGTWPLGAAPWRGSVALEDPPLYAATVFAEVLERRGMPVGGATTSPDLPLPEARRLLARREGPPLREVLRAVNKDSLNLHAEVLLRLVGVESGSDGSFDAGREALQAFLERQGVDVSGWSIRDGSGLSEGNLVSAAGLVALLTAMDRHPHSSVFLDSLPRSGVDGTLQRRLRGGSTRNRVLAKTGTLRNVHALAGYVTAADGRRLVFAILLNHYTGRRGSQAIDRIVGLLIDG